MIVRAKGAITLHFYPWYSTIHESVIANINWLEECTPIAEIGLGKLYILLKISRLQTYPVTDVAKH